MDIAGAKALKERLGHHGRDDAPAASVDVSEDAPPVYRYLGVSERALESPAPVPDEAPVKRRRFYDRPRGTDAVEALVEKEMFASSRTPPTSKTAGDVQFLNEHVRPRDLWITVATRARRVQNALPVNEAGRSKRCQTLG